MKNNSYYNELEKIICGGKRGLNAPMPSREELLARNSFGSPDDNKYLKTASQRRLEAAEREAAIARQAEVARKWDVKRATAALPGCCSWQGALPSGAGYQPFLCGEV